MIQISTGLQEFIEDNITLLEDKNRHKDLFYEFLFGDYRTEQEVEEFFKLIEELNDVALNESVKEHVLDIIVEEIDERREYTTSYYSEYNNTYYYSPSVNKELLVKWIAICGVDNIVDFIALVGSDLGPALSIQTYDRGIDELEDRWCVYPDITLLYDFDPVQGQEHVHLFDNEDDARTMAQHMSKNSQQLFESILDEEYAKEHTTLTDLDRFV